MGKMDPVVRRVYRNVAGGLLALALGACAAVSTERPLFAAADTKDAPVLKAGLWALPEPGCRFKSREAPAKWPDCVQAVEVRDGAIKDLRPLIEADRKREAKIAADQRAKYLVAAADPAVLQVEIVRDGAPRVFYFGLQPLASDADGAIIRARGWIALCRDPNPPPPAAIAGPVAAKPVKAGKHGKAAKAAKPAPAPNGLLPGLTPIPESGGGCTASSAAAVAKVVAGNEAWAFSGDKEATGWTAFWIRDDMAGGKAAGQGTLVGQAAHKVASMRKLIPHF